MLKQTIWQGQEVEYHEGKLNFRATMPLDAASIAASLPDVAILSLRVVIPDYHVYHLEFTAAATQPHDIVRLCQLLESREDIVWAEPDFAIYASTAAPKTVLYPDDPELAQQWYLNNVGAPIAWAKTQGSQQVLIAILDSGIQLDNAGQLAHPDLKAGRITLKQNLIAPGQSLNDASSDGHGTHVAGTIAADSDNRLGVAGINWLSPVHIYKIFNPRAGSPAAFAAGVTAVLRDAKAGQLNAVINFSGGTPGAHQTVTAACQSIEDHNAHNKGVSQAILCAAAGNAGQGQCDTPANLSVQFPNSVVCVGGSMPDDTRTATSNYGAELTLLAPGNAIYCTTTPSTYGQLKGTSMATPIVSGIISLLWSANKSLSAAQVIDTLKKHAVKLEPGKDHDPQWGYGRVTALWDNTFYPVRLTIDGSTAPPGANPADLVDLAITLINP